MVIRKIAILGGTGFVGRTLCNQLAANGFATRVLTRNREKTKEGLILLPDLELVETDVHDCDALKAALKGCDAAVNLVGILNEKGRNGAGFHHVHVALVEKLLAACRDLGIKRILHMSALNADAENGPSHYLRSKGMAEQLLHAATDIVVTSFRPSVIFGQHDSFFNRFAGLLHLSPGVFPLACANARFAPVYVGDVATSFVSSLTATESFGRCYELCGPNQYTLRELVNCTAKWCDKNVLVIPLNDFLSRLQAAVFDFVPGKPFSTDNYMSATRDSICACNDLPRIGVTPTAIESVVPLYLSRQGMRGRYQVFRRLARRR